MHAHAIKEKAYSGSDFEEVYPPARRLYNQIKAQTKRRPYVRASYFRKDKVFLELFWVHLNQKSRKERTKRLKYYGCGIALLRLTRQDPTTRVNPNKPSEHMHRFAGITIDGELFYVQIKENCRTRRKDLMSIFPDK